MRVRGEAEQASPYHGCSLEQPAGEGLGIQSEGTMLPCILEQEEEMQSFLELQIL